MKSGRVKFSIRVTVVGMFTIITLLTAAVAIGLQYYFNTKLAADSTLALYRQAAVRTSDFMAALDDRAVADTRLLAAQSGLIRAGRLTADGRARFAEVLQRSPVFYAAYVGFANGDICELVNLDSGPAVRGQLQALPQDRWVMVSVAGDKGKRSRRFEYYDAGFHLRGSRSEPSEYRADTRAWFINATAGKVNKTAPYLFQHLQAPGQTYSMRIAGEDAVLAIDITLASISQNLGKQSINRDSAVFLYQKSGELIASSETHLSSALMSSIAPLTLSEQQKQIVATHPVLTVANETDWPPVDFAVAGEPYGYSIDTLSLISRMTGLKFRYVNGYSWPEFVTMFREGRLDVLQPVLRTGANEPLGRLSQPFLQVPFGVLVRKGAAPVKDISGLFGKRVAIPAGWSIIETLRRKFPQVQVVEVPGVRGMFDAVRNGKVDAGIDTAALLRYTAREYFYNDVVVNGPLGFGDVEVPTGLHYSVRPELTGVAELIDYALANISDAQRKILAARWLMDGGGHARQRTTVPYPQLIELTSHPEQFNRLEKMQLGGVQQFVYTQAIGREDGIQDYFAVVTPVASVLAPAVAEVKTALMVTSAILLMLLPLASWLASFIVRPVNQLALENEKVQQRRYRELVPIDSRIVEIDELATSLMAMAHSIEKHAKEQEALMDAFIQLIAQAIDDKSPYTAGHCARVPELAIMLAQKAEASTSPPFADFQFAGEQEWREFRIGAWLHDCGKITTPEHIVDKGTKLETIYNRIHEIRMRFEVLWRDAEINYLKRCIDTPDEAAAARHEWHYRQVKLTEDYSFVAACNQGSESMSDEDMARLEQLATIQWQRNFDDRIGLSHVECSRYPSEDVALPVMEPLLADKPWHVLPREHNSQYAPHLGIRMKVPESLYNRGELYNLAVRSGTLTAEDRFKINEHIISTIRMLDKLPLPDELKRVPRYASTHHERVDGCGYPRRLTAAELSIPERVMVLADIFEALTAADRPYKAAKPVSVAIDILHRMVIGNHVDRDVFELFLTSGVYLEYAQRFLPASQIDGVDVERYLKECREEVKPITGICA